MKVTLSGTADGMFGSTCTRPIVVTAGGSALERDADHRVRDLREAGHRIEPALHRPRAGVVGAADELDDVVA